MALPPSDKQAKANLGANIKRLRGAYTLKQLADLCRTDDWKCWPSTIGQVESGRHLPGAGVATRIAYGLGILVGREITVDELLLPPPPRRKPREVLAQVIHDA